LFIGIVLALLFIFHIIDVHEHYSHRLQFLLVDDMTHPTDAALSKATFYRITNGLDDAVKWRFGPKNVVFTA
jgi:hypothetical protein